MLAWLARPVCMSTQTSLAFMEGKMSYKFKVRPHSVLPEKEIVECWLDEKLVAAIYPHEDGIRVVSKYLTDVYKEEGLPPAVIIKLALK